MAAFDLVVAMAKKMAEGGVVKRSLVDGMQEDEGGHKDGMYMLMKTFVR